MLGSLPKQFISGMEKIPGAILRVLQGQGRSHGRRGPQPSGIINTVEDPAHLVKLVNSLQQILKIFPHSRMVIIGKPNLRVEIEKRLGGRVISMMLGPSKDDITGYLGLRLDEDGISDTMNESQEAHTSKKIPETM